MNAQIAPEAVKIEAHVGLQFLARLRLGKELPQLRPRLDADLSLLQGDDKEKRMARIRLVERQALKGSLAELLQIFILKAPHRKNGYSVAGLSLEPPEPLLQIMNARLRHHPGKVIDGLFEGRNFQSA